MGDLNTDGWPTTAGCWSSWHVQCEPGPNPTSPTLLPLAGCSPPDQAQHLLYQVEPDDRRPSSKGYRSLNVFWYDVIDIQRLDSFPLSLSVHRLLGMCISCGISHFISQQNCIWYCWPEGLMQLCDIQVCLRNITTVFMFRTKVLTLSRLQSLKKPTKSVS